MFQPVRTLRTRFEGFIIEGLSGGRHYYAWLCVTLGAALIPYLFVVPAVLNGYPNVLQDDARHFVVWLRHLTDPGLYPNDIIADNFIAYTPWLYRELYLPFTALGIDPVLLHLWVIMPLSGLAFAAAAYVVSYRFWPFPMGAALVATVMNTMLGPAQGVPHDFGFTIALVLMFGFVARRTVSNGLVMFAAIGLLPVAAATSGTAMAFMMVSRRFPFLTRERAAWRALIGAGAGAVGGGVLLASSSLMAGTTFTVEEARMVPFFSPEGGRPYFGSSVASSYLCNARAGIVPLCEDGTDWEMFAWTLFVAGVVCLALWVVGSGRAGIWVQRYKLPALNHRMASVWAGLIASGLVLFPIAHWVAFKLHNPERFARYTITLTFGLIVAMAVSALFLVVLKTLLASTRTRRRLGWLLVLAAALVYLRLAESISDRFLIVRTEAADVHAHLRTTPKETLVAGVVEETDNVPAFGRRSVLGSMQLLVPYKRPYYEEMARRMTELARSLYAPEPVAFTEMMNRYSIDYIVVGRVPDDDLVVLRGWSVNFPPIQDAVRFLEGGGEPFFRARLAACVRAGNDRIVLADAACIVGPSKP